MSCLTESIYQRGKRNRSLFFILYAYTELADNLCPLSGRCAMYETLKEKEICRILDTDSKKGLTQEEAGRRLESQGENILKKGKEKNFWDMVQEQINDPMIFILLWRRRSPCSCGNSAIR